MGSSCESRRIHRERLQAAKGRGACGQGPAPRGRGMKLLVLEPDPSHGGGSEAVMLSLARELAARGHAIHLLHEVEGSMLEEYRAFCASLVRHPMPGFALRTPLRTLACVLRIASVARGLGVDAIVSSHLGFIRHCALVRLASGIPACFHLGLALEHASTAMRLAHARTGAGVAPSRHTLETWREGGWHEDALHVVRNWVDPVRFTPVDDKVRLRQSLGLPDVCRLLVFVGRVCEQKGVDLLVRAFATLADAEDAYLVIVGAIAPDFAPRFEATLEALDPAVRARILLRPATARPEAYFAAADLACVPSRGNEAFGLTVIEAMACGVPVVASAIGIIPGIVGSDDASLLVPPDDADTLAERLRHWLDHPSERAATGGRLRRHVLEHFGAAPSIDAYERIIGALACA
jgi:glycosyltransferase involved in cell wall biosynthesis